MGNASSLAVLPVGAEPLIDRFGDETVRLVRGAAGAPTSAFTCREKEVIDVI